jgi:hypothetical protein
MIAAQSRRDCGGGKRDKAGGTAAAAARALSLAAAPTFAAMALLTAVFASSQPEWLCTTAHSAAPLTGMAAMYLLMSVFHSAPWLALITSRRPST